MMVSSSTTRIISNVISSPCVDYCIPSLHCYAFAPPCVLSLDLAVKCSSLVTSFVVNEDVVPRLSYGSVEDLKKLLKYLLSQKNGKFQR
jgi:hypothetical protein